MSVCVCEREREREREFVKALKESIKESDMKTNKKKIPS